MLRTFDGLAGLYAALALLIMAFRSETTEGGQGLPRSAICDGAAKNSAKIGVCVPSSADAK